MDKDEAMLRATLKGQKIMAVEQARGFARELIMQDWAKHTSLPGDIDLKNAAFESIMKPVTEKINGSETGEALRAIVAAAFREWEATHKKA